MPLTVCPLCRIIRIRNELYYPPEKDYYRNTYEKVYKGGKYFLIDLINRRHEEKLAVRIKGTELGLLGLLGLLGHLHHLATTSVRLWLRY